MIFNSIYELAEAFAHKKLPKLYTVGIISGCFDLLHPLHRLYLDKCARQCHILLTFIDSDRLLIANKGKPVVFNERDRAYMIEGQKSVTHSVVMDDYSDVVNFVAAMRTSGYKGHILIFKNADTIYGKPLIPVPGAEYYIISDVNNYDSTTAVVNHLMKEREAGLKKTIVYEKS